MATNKQKAHGFISYFLKRYKKIYGVNPPGFNRHALSHGFEAMTQDYPGMEEQIIDFYFDNYEEHNPVNLVYSYGTIVEKINEDEVDAKERRELRQRTKERMKSVTNSSKGN